MVTPALAVDGLLSAPTSLTFFGHTHIQGGFTYRDDNIGVLHMKPAAGKHFATLTLEEGTRYLLNPGSIGQPRDGDPRAGLRYFRHGQIDGGILARALPISTRYSNGWRGKVCPNP